MWRILLFVIIWGASSILSAQPKFDYFYTEAEKCRLAGDYSSAMELYRHCLDIRKDSPQALYSLGMMYFYLQHDSLGLSYMQKASDLEPGNPWYIESLASIYMESNDIPNAIKAMEQLVALQTKRSDVLSQLAVMYKSTGRSEESLATLNRIETLEGMNPRLTLEKFTLLRDLERPEEAFGELRKLCEEFPHDQNSKLLMAKQYMLVGDTLTALSLYDEVRSVEPTNMNLQLLQLEYYASLPDKGRYHHFRDSIIADERASRDLRVAMLADYVSEATSDTTVQAGLKTTFDTLLAHPQKDAKILTLKALFQIQTKRPDEETVHTLHQVLQVEPENQPTMNMLMKYYVGKKDYRAIEDLCRLGVNYHPDDMTYHFYLGISQYEQGKKDETIETFKQATRIKGEAVDPKEVSEMFSIMGDLYHEQGRVEESFAAYDSSLVYNEENLACLNNYAYYLSLRGEQLEKAEEMSYRTVKAEPANRTYLDTYAWILFMMKNYNEARIYIDRVVSPEADEDALMANEELQGNVIEHAGDIYYMTGDAQTAVWLWTIAQNKNDGTVSPKLSKKISKKKYIK